MVLNINIRISLINKALARRKTFEWRRTTRGHTWEMERNRK